MIPNPHDALVKGVFGKPEHAQGMLRAVVPAAVAEMTDDELRNGAMLTALAKLATICLKHARTSADFIEILVRWMDVAREVARAPNGLSALAQVLCYILEVNDHVEREALQALLEREIGPKPRKPS